MIRSLQQIFGLILAITLCQMGNAQELVLAVNEGVTYQDGGPIAERYKALLELLEKELKHPIRVQNVDHYGEFDKALAAERYDLVFIHPAQIGLKAAKSGKYVGLVTARGFTDYRARVLAARDSPLHGMDDLRNKKIGVPAMESITTVMFIAGMKEIGVAVPTEDLTVTRYQDAVPFMVENKFVDAGVTASAAVIKDWTARGGRVIGETKPIPIKQFLVSRRLSAEQREKVRELLLKLSESDSGRAALKGMNMKGFVPWNDAVMDEASRRLGL
jgi:ABC-type phosphate/phosphonate transport system substrate-binding protein